MEVYERQYLLIIWLRIHEFIIKVNIETRMVIDFQNPGFEVLIKQNIEPKDLKGFSRIFFIRSSTVIYHIWKHLHDSLAALSDATYNLISVDSLLF